MEGNNKSEIDRLSGVCAELDYLLQEGVIFTQEEIQTIDERIYELQRILNSIRTFNCEK